MTRLLRRLGISIIWLWFAVIGAAIVWEDWWERSRFTNRGRDDG